MKKLIYIASLLFVGLSSCKDEGIVGDRNDMEIYMPQALENGIKQVPVYKPILDTDPITTEVVFGSYLGGYMETADDINTSFVIDPNLLTEINKVEEEEGRAKYAILPESLYKITGLESVIKAGERSSASLKFVIDNKSIEVGKKYALPIKISSVNSDIHISDKMGNTVFLVTVPDPWAKFGGDHQAKGVLTHPTAGPRNFDMTKNLVYEGNQTYYAPLGDLGGSGYYMRLKINADFSVTITPAGATPNINQTLGPNTYDPKTNTFTLNYSYSPVPITAGQARVISEKMVKK